MRPFPRTLQLHVAVTVILLFTMTTVFVMDASAYTVKRRWAQGTVTINYGVQPGIGSFLGFTDTSIKNMLADAAFSWSIGSRAKIEYEEYYTNPEWRAYAFSPQTVSAKVETVSYTDSGRRILSMVANFQPGSPGAREWHLNSLPPGTAYGCHNGVCNWSVYKVATHEFGHFLQLGDVPGYKWDCSVMDGSYTVGNGICLDDKQGATMIYGFQSGFGQAQYLGIGPSSQIIRASEHASVSAYTGTNSCSGGSPQYWTYNGNTDGVPSSPAGGRYLRFQGCSTTVGNSTTFSRTYMTLATFAHDSNGGDTKCSGSWCYLEIKSGMKLRWYQYNGTAGQCAFVPGLRFTNGEYLQDHITSAHPKNRSCGTGWRYQEIDLSSLAGWKIDEYYLNYNNSGSNSGSGSWRFYIDSLNIG
jgi:hypothetical protein